MSAYRQSPRALAKLAPKTPWYRIARAWFRGTFDRLEVREKIRALNRSFMDAKAFNQAREAERVRQGGRPRPPPTSIPAGPTRIRE